VFDPDELAELAFSLREVGVLQPVVVRPLPGPDQTSFELVVGERRWRAAAHAGLATIPALVRQTSDDAMLRDALLENLHRAQLNPLEEAAAYAQLLEEFGCSQEELAERIGRSRPQISNTIRLLRLPPLVQRRVAAGVISAGHARALLGLDDPLEQETLAQRIVAEGLSVRSVEELVAGGLGPRRRRSSNPPAPIPDEVSAAAHRLADHLDTRVSVAVGRTKGRLTIEFASPADLERIVARLLPS
jgi:ParB family chromosome partitioning protein